MGMFDTSGNKYYRNVFKGVRMKPRGFDYQPKFYDPEKEDLENRVQFVKEEMARAEERGEKFRISGQDHSTDSFYGFQERMANRKARQRKLLFLIVTLIAVAVSFDRLYNLLVSYGYIS
jgi:hypothetical protein